MSNRKRLVDCSAEFVARSEKGIRTGLPFSEAEGVKFECPGCDGGHQIIIFWRTRPGHSGPTPYEALWERPSGESLDSLTLHPSIHVRVGCEAGFHGWVKNGEVTW